MYTTADLQADWYKGVYIIRTCYLDVPVEACERLEPRPCGCVSFVTGTRLQIENKKKSVLYVSHPVNKVYMGGENLRLSVNCLYDYVLENFELSHR